MKARSKAREAALQTLYRLDMAPVGEGTDADGRVDEVLGPVMAALGVKGNAAEFARGLVHGIFARIEAIDETISRHSENWSVDRMAVIDRNVLRLAVFELTCSEETPFKVVIDEAVELSKRYGGEESGTFVNGILDNVVKTGKNG